MSVRWLPMGFVTMAGEAPPTPTARTPPIVQTATSACRASAQTHAIFTYLSRAARIVSSLLAPSLGPTVRTLQRPRGVHCLAVASRPLALPDPCRSRCKLARAHRTMGRAMTASPAVVHDGTSAPSAPIAPIAAPALEPPTSHPSVGTRACGLLINRVMMGAPDRRMSCVSSEPTATTAVGSARMVKPQGSVCAHRCIRRRRHRCHPRHPACRRYRRPRYSLPCPRCHHHRTDPCHKVHPRGGSLSLHAHRNRRTHRPLHRRPPLMPIPHLKHCPPRRPPSRRAHPRQGCGLPSRSCPSWLVAGWPTPSKPGRGHASTEASTASLGRRRWTHRTPSTMRRCSP